MNPDCVSGSRFPSRKLAAGWTPHSKGEICSAVCYHIGRPAGQTDGQARKLHGPSSLARFANAFAGGDFNVLVFKRISIVSLQENSLLILSVRPRWACQSVPSVCLVCIMSYGRSTEADSAPDKRAYRPRETSSIKHISLH